MNCWNFLFSSARRLVLGWSKLWRSAVSTLVSSVSHTCTKIISFILRRRGKCIRHFFRKTRTERGHLEYTGVEETNILQYRQCTYNVPIMTRSPTNCSTETKHCFLCVLLELHATVNNINMLSVAQEWFYDEFMSPARWYADTQTEGQWRS